MHSSTFLCCHVLVTHSSDRQHLLRILFVQNLSRPSKWRGENWANPPSTQGLPEGAAFVADATTMEPVQIILRYLVHSVRRDQVALKTEIARAWDLYEWLLYLNALRQTVDEVETDDLETYRDRLLTIPSLRTRRPLEPATVRRRLSSIISFYTWANAERLIPNHIAAEGRRSAVIGHAERHEYLTPATHVGADRILPRMQARLPEFIEKDTLQRIFADIGCDPLKPDGRTCRDWLIVFLALITGMRRAEISALTVHQVNALKPTEDKPARLRLVRTKGSKSRTVPVEGFLHDRLMAYIAGERADILKAAKQRGKFQHREPVALFLNGPHCCTKYLGMPISPSMINRMFLLSQRRLFGDSTRHVFHHLRHTHVMQRRIAGDEWDNISRDLGHRHLMTTVDTYARALNRMEPVAREQYVRGLKRLVGDGG